MKRILSVLLAASSLAACANQPSGIQTPAFDSASLVGSAWADPAGSGGNQPRLQFITSVSVNGTGGCNTFSGKVELSGSRILLGPLVSSKRMCIGPPQHVEDVFFRALDNARSVRIDDGQLVLADGTGKELIRLNRASNAASARP